MPFFGDIKGVVESITGINLITQSELALWERALGAIPLFGGILRKAVKIGEQSELLVKLGDNVYGIFKGTKDELEKLVKNLPGLGNDEFVKVVTPDGQEFWIPKDEKYGEIKSTLRNEITGGPGGGGNFDSIFNNILQGNAYLDTAAVRQTLQNINEQSLEQSLRALNNLDSNVQQNLSQAIDLIGGDTNAQQSIAETVRLLGKGSVNKKLFPQAIDDFIDFKLTYGEKVTGDFPLTFVRILSSKNIDILRQYQAEINLARDILDGTSPLGNNPTLVHAIPEGIKQTPEFSVIVAGGQNYIVESKAIGTQKSGMGKNNLDSNIGKAISQIDDYIRNNSLSASGYIRIDARSAPSNLSQDRIKKIVEIRMNTKRNGKSKGKDIIDYVEILYKDINGNDVQLIFNY